MPKNISRIFFTSIAAVFLFTGYSFAVPEDGFGAAVKLESRYFTIYYAPQLDPQALASQLEIRPLEQVITGESYADDLGGRIDTLFSQACVILDMQLPSFHGVIKIGQEAARINAAYRNIFGKELGNKRSFYLYDTNTIYISSADFKREILGHEMAHAIISRYFVVLPPLKIQEVLATYVEFQLRRLYK